MTPERSRVAAMPAGSGPQRFPSPRSPPPWNRWRPADHGHYQDQSGDVIATELERRGDEIHLAVILVLAPAVDQFGPLGTPTWYTRFIDDRERPCAALVGSISRSPDMPADEGERWRVFLAIEIPDAVREALTGPLEALQPLHESIRTNPTERCT